MGFIQTDLSASPADEENGLKIEFRRITCQWEDDNGAAGEIEEEGTLVITGPDGWREVGTTTPEQRLNAAKALLAIDGWELESDSPDDATDVLTFRKSV